MFIVCPHCATSYAIDLAALGDTGRTVRCSRCKEVWLAHPEDAVDAPAPMLATAGGDGYGAMPDSAEAEWEALARDEKMRAAVQEGIDAANSKLARVEQIKKFHIVEGDWEPGGDELTPTMKLKRKPIDQKYEAEIEGMYSG